MSKQESIAAERRRKTTLSVVLAVIGLYFLCLYDGFGALYTGDIVVLICAMAFAVQILCVDRYIGEVDGVKLSSLQFLVTGILSAILMLIFIVLRRLIRTDEARKPDRGPSA